ncbi:Hsp70 family protein [Gulosibacter sediminis]|uniref:Hsp70 family protein n=1 Tax=Gulosibacter sediminis TaxID=1729695 RepID=UPI0024A9DCCC|nr:Hsp70 family protein [Gulosibacter sediminis]
MRLGIDFGTTRTLVALVDRGNYPVIGVEDALGDPHEHIPSVVALAGDRMVCGWDALAQPGAHARSFKRLLGTADASAGTPVPIGDETRPLGEVLAAFAAHVVEQLRQHPLVRDREAAGDRDLEAVVGVPANAGNAQRLLTLDAFARAGVHVLALVNEPSAAAFEYSHRHARTLNSRRTDVVIYDLGGGTFDASLVRIDGAEHEVRMTSGDPHLGGDDFDERLVGLALGTGEDLSTLPNAERERLLEEARTAKERLTPQTRRLLLERGDDDVIVLVSDFNEAATPLIERTIAVMAPNMAASGAESGDLSDSDIAGIYLVGGASALPLVPRLLRERFGRRVHRSPYPAASTAIGLAIAADAKSDYWLRDRSSRGIGVFREREGGRAVDFDVLVEAGDAVAGATTTREYRAAHNVGWFRFVEFTRGASGVGNLTTLAEVLVPFTDELAAQDRAARGALARVPVERREGGPLVREEVSIDANGIVTITHDIPELGLRKASRLRRDAS